MDAIWELIEESQNTGVSLPTLARTKQKEKQGGCSEHTVRHWMNKLHAMYSHRASLSFRDVRFFNLITDSSTFSTRDTCVSIMYSTERDLGCYLAAQAVKGNLVTPNEMILDETVERMVALRKANRIASYRLLQAFSHQLSVLSDHKVSIRSFLVDDLEGGEQHPLAVALRPLTPDQLRIVERYPTGEFKSVHVMVKRMGVLA